MPRKDRLIPDLDWLSAHGEVDDYWIGPGPRLVNLDAWIHRLASAGHPHTMRSFKTSAFISMVCAVNAFRKSAERGVREAMSVVTGAIRRQLAETE